MENLTEYRDSWEVWREKIDKAISEGEIHVSASNVMYNNESSGLLGENVQGALDDVADKLDTKVDKVNGKQLSTNDFTNALKDKLDGIQTGAEVNVQSDWLQNDTSADDYIKNKPTLDGIPTQNSTNGVQSGGVYNSLESKIDKNKIGVAGGIAELGTDGKVLPSQLPETIEAIVNGYYYEGVFYEDAQHSVPITPSTKSLYIDIVTEKTYRWSGMAYAETSPSLALGETSSTAYRGDRGKIAYDFSQNPYNNEPNMDGTASSGSSTLWSRGDHTHPHDNTKVDKVSGKQLSTNDFTTALKNKLDGIQAGAEANVQSNWSQSDNTADDYIKNKPTIPTVNNSTITIQKNGTTVDSFTTNTSSNKTINITMAKSDVGLGNVPNVTTNNQTPTFTTASTRANIASGETLATILGKIAKFFADLKTVAFSGSYADLSNKPTIPTVNNSTITIQKNSTTVDSFTTNASSDKTIDITMTKSDVGLGSVPNVSTNNQKPTFTVASTRANIASGETLTVILGKIAKFFTDLKTVAFSGSYTDLSNKPTIPTVNNGTLTIQRNGTNVATFTANQSGNTTANIIDNNTTYSAGFGLSLSSTTFSLKSIYTNVLKESTKNIAHGTYTTLFTFKPKADTLVKVACYTAGLVPLANSHGSAILQLFSEDTYENVIDAKDPFTQAYGELSLSINDLFVAKANTQYTIRIWQATTLGSTVSITTKLRSNVTWVVA